MMLRMEHSGPLGQAGFEPNPIRPARLTKRGAGFHRLKRTHCQGGKNGHTDGRYPCDAGQDHINCHELPRPIHTENAQHAHPYEDQRPNKQITCNWNVIKMADRGGETCKIRKRHPPQHNRQEKRRVSDDQMHTLFTGAKGQLFHVCCTGFKKF